MAWTAPMTASAGIFTAANWNLQIRDNLLMQTPALATAAGKFFVSTAANTLAARSPIGNATTGSATTTSTSYAALGGSAGPTCSLTTGTKAIVTFGCQMKNSTANTGVRMSFAVSGATSISASDTFALVFTINGADNNCCSSMATLVSLTAGSNTFTSQYRVNGGTGTFANRYMTVFSL